MKKVFIFGVLVLFLISFVVGQDNDENQTLNQTIPENVTPTLIENITENLIPIIQENASITKKICCKIQATVPNPVPDYEWKIESDCSNEKDGELIVGAGYEIVEDSYCQGKINKIETKKVIQVKNKLKTQVQAGECPEKCTCSGSVMKCEVEGGREMTISAGKSGNTIVQVKGINMSTKVTLYKSEDKIYGVFRNNQTKEIKVLPDQVKEKINQKIRTKLKDQEIELDEDGVYQVKAQKRARLFFMFPVNEQVEMQMDSETGEITRMRNSWWGFLARDVIYDGEDTEE